MQTKAQLMHVYDAIAQNYGGYRRRPWPALANFLKKVEKSALILDLGCGNTPYSNSLKNKKIVGLDFSFGQLGLARKNLKLLVQADASELPFKSETFDYIIFIAALHHLLNNKQRLQALKEARRVTKRGGRALVSVWARWQRRFFPLNLFKAK